MPSTYLSTLALITALATSPIVHAQTVEAAHTVLNDFADEIGDVTLLEPAKDGKLAVGDIAEFTFTLDAAHTHYVLGACDLVCGDIDLVVTDAESGEIIWEDFDESDFVQAEIDPGTRRINVSVLMMDCDDDQCAIAIGLYR